MIDVGVASERILARIQPLGAESVALAGASGRVLADKIVAATTSPPWDNSSMDGYAVRSEDFKHSSNAYPTLDVVAKIAAGSFAPRELRTGEAMRIMTGAPIPAGADSVIRIEDTDRGAEHVSIRDARDLWRNIRRAGEDFRAGDTLFGAGTELRAAHLGVLASAAIREVTVHRKPKVAILSSGDELVELDDYTPADLGKKIVSANSWTLSELVRDAGGEAIDLGIAKDTPESLREKLSGVASVDLIITSAGVSIGDLDYVRTVFAELGGTLDFWKVRMRPGAPMAFGLLNEIPWLGFSGNPVSAMVSFEIFARPAIRKMLGHSRLHHALMPVRLTEDVVIAAPLLHFLRATIRRASDGALEAALAGSQSSAVLTTMARANALLVVPAESLSNPAGSILNAIPLGNDLDMSDQIGLR
jgi:molybdopterin molybdotransferase